MRRQHHLRKKFALKSFLEYGYHLWVLLLLANVLIAYQFNLFGFAAENPDDTLVTNKVDTSVTVDPNSNLPTKRPTPTITPTVTPTPKPPAGPVIDLAFSIPGIGSGGGTMKPLRPTRNLIIYLYATDVNSNDNKVRPLYTKQTTASFNTNELSPLYTAFESKNIDLGDTVKNGKYQIAFKTDQSMRTLVKEKVDAIGGKLVTVSKNIKAELPLQRAIMGDMAPPEGNNVMDIIDYDLFIACYSKYPDCPGAKQVDLNDDGVLDGIDYNIMALGFKSNLKNGIAPPQLPTIAPTQVSKLSQLKITPKPRARTTPAVSPGVSPGAIVKKSTGGNPVGGILGFIFFLLLIGGSVFALKKTRFGKELLAKLPQKGSAKPAVPAQPEAEAPQTAPETQEVQPDATATTIAESTEIPIAELQAAKNAAPTTEETPSAEPAPAAADVLAAAGDPSVIDKTFYVKNKSKDDKGNWFVLTDDAGPVDGLFTGDIVDGFERIKGTMVEENGKKYVKITEVLPTEG